MFVQLNPSLPLSTPKGEGLAIGVCDMGIEHHLIWVVIQDETGQIWQWENKDVRGTCNITMGRNINNKFLRNNEPKKHIK